MPSSFELIITIYGARRISNFETICRKAVKVQVIILGQRNETVPARVGTGIHAKELIWRSGGGEGRLSWIVSPDQLRHLRQVSPKVKLYLYAVLPDQPSIETSILLGWVSLDLRSPDENASWQLLQNSSTGGELKARLQVREVPLGSPQDAQKTAERERASPSLREEESTADDQKQSDTPEVDYLALGSRGGDVIYILTVTLDSASNLSALLQGSQSSFNLSSSSASSSALSSNSSYVQRPSYWLSYTLFGVVVQTEIFRSLSSPTFTPLCDSFRLRSCLRDLVEAFQDELASLSVFLCTTSKVLGVAKIPLSNLLAPESWERLEDSAFFSEEISGEFEFAAGPAGSIVRASAKLERETDLTVRERGSLVEGGAVEVTTHSAHAETGKEAFPSLMSTDDSTVATIRNFLHSQGNVAQDTSSSLGLHSSIDVNASNALGDERLGLPLDTGNGGRATGSTDPSSDESSSLTPHVFRISVDLRSARGFVSEGSVSLRYNFQVAGPEGKVKTPAIWIPRESDFLLPKAFMVFELDLNEIALESAFSELLRIEVWRIEGDAERRWGVSRVNLARLLETKKLYYLYSNALRKAFTSSKSLKEFQASDPQAANALVVETKTLEQYVDVFGVGAGADEEPGKVGELRIAVLLEDLGPRDNRRLYSLRQHIPVPPSYELLESRAEAAQNLESSESVFKTASPKKQIDLHTQVEHSITILPEESSLDLQETQERNETKKPQEIVYRDKMEEETFDADPSIPLESSPQLKALVKQLQAEVEQLRLQKAVDTQLAVLKEQAKWEAETKKREAAIRAEAEIRARELAESRITAFRKEFEETQVSWNAWKRQEEAQWEQRLKEKEARRLEALQMEVEQREHERKLVLEAAQAEYSRLEARLRKSLADLEARERALRQSEDEVKRQHAEKLAEIQVLQRRLRSENSHALAMASKETEMMQRQLKLAEDAVKLREERIQQVEEDFAKYREQQRKTSEAQLQTECIRLSTRIQDLDAKLEKEVQLKLEALDGKRLLREQVEKLARALKKEKQRERTKIQEELEQLRLQYLAREERFVLDGDREELRTIRRELDQLRSSGPVDVRNMGNVQFQAFANDMNKEASVLKAREKKMTRDHNNNTSKSPKVAEYAEPEERGESPPPLITVEEALADSEVSRLRAEKETLLGTGVYTPDHYIVKELDRLLHIAESTRRRLQ